MIFFVLLLLLSFSWAESPPSGYGKKVCFVQEAGMNVKTSHSQMIAHLSNLGYQVDVFDHTDKTLKFEENGQFLYNQLIVFLPEASSATKLSASTMVRFLDAGHNIVVATTSKVSDLLNMFTQELYVEFDAPGTGAIDHFEYIKEDSGKHSLIASRQLLVGKPILSSSIDAPILYQGVVHKLQPYSPLLIPILVGSDHAYSFDLNSNAPADKIFASGRKTHLVSAVQARNGGRVLISGSIDLFGDHWASHAVVYGDSNKPSFSKSGNKAFVEQTISWTFQERGVLRAKNVEHHTTNKTDRNHYIVKDQIEFSMDVEEWEGNQQKWVPFVTQALQLEFKMMDPYIRTVIPHIKQGHYSKVMKLPDQYGVFTFEIKFYEKGYTGLGHLTERAPVYPLRHDMYERFIDTAIPYYVTSFSMMAAVFIFSLFFLFHKDK